MFSFLNSVVDMQKKQADYFVDAIPEGVYKTVAQNVTKIHCDLAYKSIEVMGGYVDGLKKVYAK